MIQLEVEANRAIAVPRACSRVLASLDEAGAVDLEPWELHVLVDDLLAAAERAGPGPVALRTGSTRGAPYVEVLLGRGGRPVPPFADDVRHARKVAERCHGRLEVLRRSAGTWLRATLAP